jgi:predicted lipase
MTKRTAETILSAVQMTISAHNATQVTVIGHSLGCALALLDGMYLPLRISGVSFRTIGYGCPRVSGKRFRS